MGLYLLLYKVVTTRHGQWIGLHLYKLEMYAINPIPSSPLDDAVGTNKSPTEIGRGQTFMSFRDTLS